jgi:hypothetical protein
MSCRPYISIDVCHLKGKWKEALVVAMTIKNKWICHVAYVVIEGENEDSWK